jgi:ribonuclease P protein component
MFERLYREGRRLDTQLIRGYYLSAQETPAIVQVAFVASSKTFNSVQRHRIKRLMREAFRTEWPELRALHNTTGRSTSLLLVFKGRKEMRGISFQAVNSNIATLCRALHANF